ncbi:helix-turn-helix domain-containing protein [Haloferax sp. DFSO52]|uniref:helix-turn-helix domain-containing protein n=1 Tax=Haloferax sp. DFSO52 TaxID=3388505 RepID=UPI003A87AD5E
MSTIATLRVPTTEFVLDETLSGRSSIEARPLRSVQFDGASLSPAMWIRGDDSLAIDALLEDDPSVANPSRLLSTDDGGVYRTGLNPTTDVTMRLFADTRLNVVGAHGQGSEWVFRVLTDDRSSLGSVVEQWQRTDLQHTVERLEHTEDLSNPDRFGLTVPQYQTLVTAFREGYYDIPREANLTAIANILGISHQAVSQRLRRGHERLIQRALVERPPRGFPF